MRNSQEIYTLHKITITENINNYILFIDLTIHIVN